MFYGNIKDCDVANGPGIRVTLFVSGCTNACPGCFQKQTWDFRYGEAFTDETEQKLLRMLKPSYVRGLTLLGGEPFEPENQRALVPFLKRVRTEAPEKDIWCFTGNRLEELTGAAKDGELIMDGDPRQSRAAHLRCEVTDEMLDLIDVLVDGRFVERLKDLSLEFRGSSNQRLIDLPKTIAKGQIVLWENKASARPLTKSSGKT